MNNEAISFKSWVWWGVCGGALLTLLLYHASLYSPFIADDALISLRYADRLLSGEGLTWTAGEWVEGYSNLAWVLGVSGIGLLGFDLITATRVLGILSMIAASSALYSIADDLSRSTKRSVWFAASLVLCCSPPIAVWVIGGLEQTMYIAALLWFSRGVNRLLSDSSPPPKRLLIGSGFAGGLLCVTRPDGPLFIVIFGVFYAVRELFFGERLFADEREEAGQESLGSSERLSRLCRALPLVGIPLAFFAAQLIFRLWYYQEWVPNTAHIKATISAESWVSGMEYMRDALSVIYPLALPALLSWKSPQRSAVLFSWVTLFSWSMYVIAIGGDIFPGHRHIVVIMALVALLAAQGLSTMSRLKDRLMIIGLIGLCGGLSYRLSQDTETYTVAKMERWEWDGKVVGEWLGASFRERDPLLAVTAAGALPYFTGFRSLDMQGLNDRHIAHQAPQEGYQLAHNHGDGDYVLSRRPDLIAFRGVGLGDPAFVSGDQMKKSREFVIRYRKRRFEGQYPYFVASELFVRLDGALGVQLSGDASDLNELRLPPYLFRKSIGSPAPSFSLALKDEESDDVATHGSPRQLKVASEVIARWPLEEIMYLNNFPLSAGQWSVELDPPYPFRIQKLGQVGKGSANLGIQILTSAEALELAAPKKYKRGQEVFLRGVVLKKIGEAPRASFSAAQETLDKAQQIEQRAISQLKMRTLEDFEGTPVMSHEETTEWTGEWRGTSALSRFVTSGGVRRQNKVRRYGGERLFNTFTAKGGDRETCRLWSPKMILPPHAVLSFKVGGGQLSRGVGVRLWIDGIAIGTWAGRDSEALSMIHLDLRLFVGRYMQIELIDRGQGEWGHLLVDDVWLSQHIRSARERSQYEESSLKK